MGVGDGNAASFLLPTGRRELCCGSGSHLSLLGRTCRAVTSAQRLHVEVFASRGKDLVGPCSSERMSVSSRPVPIALSL